MLFLGLIASAQTPPLQQGTLQSKNFNETISFEFIHNKIIIPVEIQGKTYRFFIDTGAPNMISEEVFKTLKTPIVDSLAISDIHKNKEVLKIVTLPELNIGTLHFVSTEALVFDFKSNTMLNCYGADGIVGSNALRHLIFQMNIKNHTILFTDNKKSLDLKNANSIKMDLIGAQSAPAIWLKIANEKNSVSEQVIIDTGFNQFYDISLKNYEIFEPDHIFEVLASGKGNNSLGLFEYTNTHTPVHKKLLTPAIYIGKSKFINYTTTTQNDNNSKIGAEIINHGITTIDFLNKRFYFKSFTNDELDLTSAITKFSPTIINGKIAVGFVWDNALKEDIKPGDLIIRINDTPITEENLCNLFFDDTFNQPHIKIVFRTENGEIEKEF